MLVSNSDSRSLRPNRSGESVVPSARIVAQWEKVNADTAVSGGMQVTDLSNDSAVSIGTMIHFLPTVSLIGSALAAPPRVFRNTPIRGELNSDTRISPSSTGRVHLTAFSARTGTSGNQRIIPLSLLLNLRRRWMTRLPAYATLVVILLPSYPTL